MMDAGSVAFEQSLVYAMMDAGSVASEQSLESALAELVSDGSVYAEELRAWYKRTDGHE